LKLEQTLKNLELQTIVAYSNSENKNIIVGNNNKTKGENRSIYIKDGNQIKINILNIAYYNLNSSNCGFGTDFPNKDHGLLKCIVVGVLV
jgi:hypothetical protein